MHPSPPQARDRFGIPEKLRTFGWFVKRPSFYPHLLALLARKLTGSVRLEEHFEEAWAWASELAVPPKQALCAVGHLDPRAALPPGVPERLLAAAAEKAASSTVTMGGPGDLDLLYRAILLIRATRVIETGVAYGWSSLAALAALRETRGRLASVDMPYPKTGNEPFVGVVVPDEWRARWTLIRQPDRNDL